MMSIKRGDIIRVLFPNSDLKTSKRRPALFIQADNLNTNLPADGSSINYKQYEPRRSSVARAVLLGSAEANASGLRLDSVIMTDNLVTILDSEIDSVLGSLSDMSKIETALLHTLGISIVKES